MFGPDFGRGSGPDVTDARAHLPARLLLMGTPNYLRPFPDHPTSSAASGREPIPRREVAVETWVKGTPSQLALRAVRSAKVLRGESGD